MAPDAESPGPRLAGTPKSDATTRTDDRQSTPHHRQERLKVLEGVLFLIAVDVARELDHRPEGWDANDYADCVRMFWSALADEAVTAGIERHRQGSK